jgi:hypothetical protein
MPGAIEGNGTGNTIHPDRAADIRIAGTDREPPDLLSLTPRLFLRKSRGYISDLPKEQEIPPRAAWAAMPGSLIIY